MILPTTATAASGASLQFNALVTGTNQSSVLWTTSASSISSGGLLTAPQVRSPTSVIVTATSRGANIGSASAVVYVTVNDGLTINTTSLATATVGMMYKATLSVSGGQAPYLWKIVSGTLPEGIQLEAASGSISGIPSVVGSSSFAAGVMDSNGQTAQQNLTLVATSGSVCGPPTYSCSRSDLAAIIPTAPPQLGSNPAYYGGHSGAGMVAIDPSYGNRILRVTDGNTDPDSPGMSVGTSWSAEANLMSSDESLFFVSNEGNTPCLFQLEQQTFKVTFHHCRYHRGEANLQFGYTPEDSSAFYNYSGPYLHRYVIDRSNWGISIDPAFNHGQGYFDPDGPNCLNGQLAALGTWYVHDTSLSSDDSTFAAAMGPEQDLDPYVVIWNANKGCRWINVQTWEMSQGWNTGLVNPVKITWVSGTTPALPGGMHNVGLDRSGQYAILVINGTTLGYKVFWDVDGNVVNDTCYECLSHWACDFGVCFWSFGPPGQGFQMRDLAIVPTANMSTMGGNRDIVITPVTASTWLNDEHAAHQNASTDRKNPYLIEESQDSGGFQLRTLGTMNCSVSTGMARNEPCVSIRLGRAGLPGVRYRAREIMLCVRLITRCTTSIMDSETA